MLIRGNAFLLTMVIILFLAVDFANCQEFEPPDISASIALQVEAYREGDSTSFVAIPRPADNAFTIRHAVIGVSGQFGDQVEYNMEVGAASCQKGGFMLMEVGAFYRPLDFLKAGFMKGHVLRGFEFYQECIAVTTAEKPFFAKKFSPCHPTGAMIETDYDIGKTMGIHVQLTCMNGTGGTLEDEHDINLGFQFRTPLPGLTLGGFYTDWQWNVPRFSNYYDSSAGQWVAVEIRNVYNGYRTGLGFNFDRFNAHVRGEFYYGKGFEDRVKLIDNPGTSDPRPKASHGLKAAADETDDFPYEDTEMSAFFIETAYTFEVASDQLTYIQPYIQYQYWDQAAHLDKGDFVLSLITFGATFGIGSGNIKLRIEYQTNIEFPDENTIDLIPYSEEQAADRFILRLQTDVL